MKILAVLAGLLVVLAVAAPLHVLFLTRYPLVILDGSWSMGGIRMDSVDLVLGVLLLALFMRGVPPAEAGRHRWPYMLPWVALGVMLSLSYLAAPINQENLTALHRALYQLYRYSWKGILFYPLALLLLNDRAKIQQGILAIVVAGDLLALQATFQGYAGNRGTGPFDTGNELAGALVAPLLLSAMGILRPQTRFRLFWIGSTLLMFRGLLFTSSRGGIVACAAGAAFCAFWLLTRPAGRARIARLVPAAMVLGALLLLLKPDILDRPTVRKAISAREGVAASTVQWRIQERWPHFIKLIEERPWLGVGTAVDRSLSTKAYGTGAATPHNGYLAIAVAHGIPVAALYVLIALLSVKNGLRLFAYADSEWEATLGLLIAGAILAVLVHNLVEASLRLAFTRDVFWMLCAISAQRALQLKPSSRKVPAAAPAGALAPGMSP